MQVEKQIANEQSVTRQNAQFIVGATLIAILLFDYYAITWCNAYNFRAAMDVCTKPFCDLADYYYPMGEAIFQTKLPIEGFVYSPFIAILFAVFPPLGIDASLLIWGIQQAIFVILYLVIFRRLVPASLLIFILPFLFRRDWCFLLYAATACGIFLIVVPCLLLGIGDTLNFYSALLDQYRHFDWVMTSYNSQFFPHVILRLTEGNGFDHSVFRFTSSAGFNLYASLKILRGISYSIAALNVGLVFLIQRVRLPNANPWSVHILFLTIPFILPTSWPVDLVYLPFGQALLTWKILEGENALSWRHPLPARKVALLLLIVSIVISNIVFFNIIGDRIAYGSVGFIFWSGLLLLVVSYMELLPTLLRQIRMKFGRQHYVDISEWTAARGR